MHTSHALPQLREFYGNEKNKSLAQRIEKWQTISGICLFRWSGRPNAQMPISHREASWTGLLDCRTGCWDDEAVDLLKTCPGIVQYQFEVEDEDEEEYLDEIDLLPPTAPYHAPLPFLRVGIPQHDDDGLVNSYWARWPKLQSFPIQLLFGTGKELINDSGGVMKSVRQSADQDCDMTDTRCVSPQTSHK